MIVCVLSNKSALQGGSVYFNAVNKGKKKICSIFYHKDRVDHFFLSVWIISTVILTAVYNFLANIFTLAGPER